MLRFVVLLEGEGAIHLARSLIVLRAADFPDARNRAVELGVAMQRTYLNGDRLEVRWRLERVETLDLLGDAITDGQEIHAQRVNLEDGEEWAFDAHLTPANHEPPHSGI